jgi:hypothetical protein
MPLKSIAFAAAFACACTSAQAQAYGPCAPERTIDALANAVLRVAPLFVKPKAQPAAQIEPAAQQAMGREQWKQHLIDQGRRFCEQYPDDVVCGAGRR